MEEIMALYTFLFTVWRLGSIVLQAAQGCPTSQAPASPVRARSCLRELTHWAARQFVDFAGFLKDCVFSLITAVFGLVSRPHKERRRYAVKIALAITIASLLTILPPVQSRFAYSYWAAVRVCMDYVLPPGTT
jgi:hypothetical protein